MQLSTRDFGVVDVKEQDIIEFTEPMFGFDEYRRYVMLCDEEIGNHFAWLQSTDDPDLCFLLADPELAKPSYREAVPQKALANLGEAAAYECWVVMVVPEENFSEATVNLKSPVIINTENRHAAQIILDEDYPIRCPLNRKEEKPSC